MTLPVDSMTQVKNRCKAAFSDLNFYFERPPGKDDVVILRRNGGSPLESQQNYLSDAPLVDIICFTSTTDINASYEVANRIAGALRSVGARLNTAPVSIQTGSEKASTKGVLLSAVFYIE